ncbi:MAG: hypothetical protein M1368_06750, partial [Thaumarchaeota archaeon]|nr:hypothetical protein [Nitrososphaerota archaeon]
MYNGILFGITAAVSLVATIILGYLFAKSTKISRLLWSIAFFVLGMSTALISTQGLGVLSQPVIAPVDSLIPGLIAAGLIMSRKASWGFYFLAYVIIAFGLILALAVEYGALAAPYVMLVHFPSGLVIFLLPT